MAWLSVRMIQSIFMYTYNFRIFLGQITGQGTGQGTGQDTGQTGQGTGQGTGQDRTGHRRRPGTHIHPGQATGQGHDPPLINSCTDVTEMDPGCDVD